MMHILQSISDYTHDFINWLGYYGPFFGCLLIAAESILPILPLSLFITINFLAFGSIWGFIISWIFTIIGCSFSFFLFQNKLQKWFELRLRNKYNLDKFMKAVENIKFPNLVVLIAIPFTPAFLVNIAAGLSKMTFKKFFLAILIGKIFLIFFWGYLGTTLVESLTNPSALIKVVIMTIVAYIISYLINRKLKID
jgi:uncharacterized membrane protein YdjX (TVP38/TMEM64 family)